LIDALSAEDFDVKSSSIPHAHTKYKQEVCTRPERRDIENKDRRNFCKDSIDLHNVAVSMTYQNISAVLTKLPQHKVQFSILRLDFGEHVADQTGLVEHPV
jgi:hypothetical protein